MNIFTNAHFLLTLTSLFWAFNTIAGRAAVDEVSPLLVVSVRWFFVSIILTFLCRKELIASWKVLKNRLKWLVIMGLFGFTSFNSFYYIAAHDTIAINLGLVQGTMPAFIIIISRFWLKEQINLPQLFGVLITFFAVLLVVSSGNLYALMKLQLNKGDIVMIFACTLYAVYAVGLRKKPKIGALVKDFALRARDKKLKPDEMDGSTFTISNLGMFGIQEFTSIINQPNGAILSVGAIIQKPVVKNGNIVIGNTMKLTLASDHRVVDGATGAKFLQTLREYIENPLTMVL